MTGKELVLRAAAFQPVPRVPVAVLDGYLWLLKRRGMSMGDLLAMEDGAAAKLIADHYEQLGSDMVFAPSLCYSALQEALGGTCDYSAVGAPAAVKKRGVSGVEQAAALDPDRVWEALERHPILLSHRRRLELLHGLVGEEKLIMAFSLGPMTLASSLVGMEDLLAALIEEPETVEKVLDVCAALSGRIIDDQLDHGATGVSIADPLSSAELLDEATFEELCLPRLRTMTARGKAHGAPVMLHICGASAPRLEPLRDAGIDIYSLDAVDLAEALKAGAGRYAVFGNLNTVEVMLNAAPEEVARRARALCEAAGKEGGFILAPACDLPPDTPLENILAMTAVPRA